MTSKEFYRKTSEMAYQVKFADMLPSSEDPIVVGKVGAANSTREDIDKLLEENDFFAVDVGDAEIDLENLSFILEFHYGIDDWDAFHMKVCDVIDCRDAGGRLVISTNGYEKVKEVHPSTDGRATQDEQNGTEEGDDAKDGASIFDILDRFVDGFRFPAFPRFSDFDKTVADTTEAIAKVKAMAKNDNKVKFYDFSCSVDPDGTVHVTRTTNDGTVKKSFKLGDKEDAPKKLDIEDDATPHISKAVKELKDIL